MDVAAAARLRWERRKGGRRPCLSDGASVRLWTLSLPLRCGDCACVHAVCSSASESYSAAAATVVCGARREGDGLNRVFWSLCVCVSVGLSLAVSLSLCIVCVPVCVYLCVRVRD